MENNSFEPECVILKYYTINVKWEGGGDVGPQCFAKDLI
jgi:hypothetical protein